MGVGAPCYKDESSAHIQAGMMESERVRVITTALCKGVE
jgi:hypothetical protein